MATAGGSTQLKAFLEPLKRAQDDPVVGFETRPGQQMQAEITHVRRGRHPLIAVVAKLGDSRASFVRVTTNDTADTLCACLLAALSDFGGAPAHLLLDNAKAMVVERDVYGGGQNWWPGQILVLSEECSFTLLACRPYRAKTKVEGFNGYLKGSFIVPLAAA